MSSNTKKLHTKRKSFVQLGLFIPVLFMLITFFALPYMNMVGISFQQFHPENLSYDGFTFMNYLNTSTDAFFWRTALRTFEIAFISTIISLLLGYPIAYHIAHSKGNKRTFLIFLVLVPLLVGLVIRSYGWIVLLQDNGLINQLLISIGLINEPLQLMYNSLGVTIALVHIFLPFIILPIAGSIQGINPDFALAARSLGATPVKIFFRVTLPLSLPGVISGTILVFLLSISAFAIPMLIGKSEVMMSSIMIVRTIQDYLNWPEGSTMAIIFFLISIILLLIYNKIMGKFVKGLNA